MMRKRVGANIGAVEQAEWEVMAAKHSLLKRATTPAFSALSALGNYLHPERNSSPLIISGSPRGGTTWIAESIAEVCDSRRLIWEPLQDGNVEREKLPPSKRPWIDESNETPETYRFFSDLLGARRVNAHLLRARKWPANVWWLLSNQRLLVKFVRGNGVVGYLKRRFSIPKPMVLVRHPCAVISSQLHMGRWEDHPYIDYSLVERQPHLAAHVDADVSLAERLAITWAADMLAAAASREDVQIVFYEKIVMEGASALWPVFREWGWERLPEGLEDALSRSSSTAHKWSSLGSREQKLARWKNELDSATIEKILARVHAMGVPVYTDDIFPR